MYTWKGRHARPEELVRMEEKIDMYKRVALSP